MERTPIISLLHATARVEPSPEFPRGYRAAHDEFLACCAAPELVEYVIAVHHSRWAKFLESPLYQTLTALPWGKLTIVCNNDRDCVVDQLNAAARASSGMLLMGVMDDYFPPQFWDSIVLDMLPRPANRVGSESWGNAGDDSDMLGETVLHWSTGSPRDPDLMIGAAITRSRYERMGYVLHPDFESMFADDYFTFEVRRDCAAGLCRLVTRLDVVFEHRHPALGKGVGDEIYAQENRRQAYQTGYVRYRRMTTGARVIAVVMPGETFSHRWVFSMFDVLSRLEQSNYVVERYGAYTSNVYATRIELTDAVLSSGTDPDFVLCVDDDNPPSPADVSTLIADLDGHPELAGVVGWCWCDTGEAPGSTFRMSCGRQGPNLECMPFSVEDYCRMQAAGKVSITSDDIAPDAFWSGFPLVLLRGSALKAVGWQGFLPMLGNYHRGFTSEDTTWFRRAFLKGLKFAVDLRVKVPHLKLRPIEPTIIPAEWQGRIAEYLDRMEKSLQPVGAAD